MKLLKIFFIFSIMLISGCDTKLSQNYEKFEDFTSHQTPLMQSGERLAYTRDTLRLLSGEDSGNNSGENTTVSQKDSTLLSSYSTKILTSDPNRYNNIKIVTDKLNGFILEPGVEFSFNNELGPYGKDDGFLEAKILLSNGEESTGYGGGVCQLSTTLYNAVKDLENIKITEHHNHSVPVAYAPKNQDATVSLQSGLDFKFINNYKYPIRFETEHNPQNVTVKIYADADTGDVRYLSVFYQNFENSGHLTDVPGVRKKKN